MDAARRWASAFVEHVKANPETATDEAAMTRWFSDAILRSVEKLMLSRDEAAAMLGVSSRTVDRWIAVRRLSAKRIGRCVRIRRDDLERFARGSHPGRAA